MEHIVIHVAGLFIGQADSVESSSNPRLDLTFEGVLGDRHYGFVKNAGVREGHFPKGLPIRNNRQFSAVSIEEMKGIAEDMGVPHLKPEWLGANLLFEGCPNLSELPPLSLLMFENGAALRILGRNKPCRHPGDVIQAQYPDKQGLAAQFVRHSLERRGVVGWVEAEGIVNLGDSVEVVIPK